MATATSIPNPIITMPIGSYAGILNIAQLPKFDTRDPSLYLIRNSKRWRRCEIALTNLSGQPAPTNPTNKTVTAITLNHFR
jgi:hypothetical protein